MPQSGPQEGQYEYRDAEFWTCGFFPGSIYALLERAIKFPAYFEVPEWYRESAAQDLLLVGRHWSVAINQMSSRTDTHDMGFIVLPALQKDWELTGNIESRQSVINAAYALVSRYNPQIGAIRSWDNAVNHSYSLVDMEENFLVIIDSMCNLDLLYYVGHLIADPSLIEIATTHAKTVRNAILREDFSSYHLVNFDPRKPGSVKGKMTNQGYRDSSTWSRGQAWAIMGFAQTYMWTKNVEFLDTAIGCAKMFLKRLVASTHHHPFVPVWDFDAPQVNPSKPLRDSSAGVIAANGLLLIHQALQGLPARAREHDPELSDDSASNGDYLDFALRIVRETLDMSLEPNFATLAPVSRVGDGYTTTESELKVHIVPSSFDAILKNATVNNHEHSFKRYSDHGLVYADYYLLEFGNKMCRMGLC